MEKTNCDVLSGPPGLGRECGGGGAIFPDELSRVIKMRDILSITRLPGISLFSQSIENIFFDSVTPWFNTFTKTSS